MTPRSDPSSGRRVALTVGVLLPLVVLGLAELVLRGTSEDEAAFAFRSHFPAKSGDGLLVEHPTRFYTLRPDRRVNAAHAGRYASAGWPFRGRMPGGSPAAAYSAELRHVLVLGDSCVFGQGLDVDDTLPARLGRELAMRGFGAGDVQVTNLGVPGYSSVQIERLLEEHLGRVRPEVVVLYPGAWNDGAVALGRSDVQLAEQGAGAPRLHVARVVRRWLGSGAASEALAAERVADFEAGQDVPRRVPLEDYRATLARIEALCRASSAQLVLVAPAHPSATATGFAHTRRYAEATAAFARASSLPLVDASTVLAASGHGEAHLFLDFVHPAAPAMQLLAEALVERVAAHLGPVPTGPSARTWSVSPGSGSTLGDEWIELTSDPPLSATDGVRVSVGQAPLLGLEFLPDGRLRGRTTANAAGVHTLSVWSGDRWFY